MNQCVELVGDTQNHSVPPRPTVFVVYVCQRGGRAPVLFRGDPATAIEAEASLPIAHVSANTHFQYVICQCAGGCTRARAGA